MQGFGLIDGIIEEPLGGAHRDSDWMFNTVKDRILKEIASLQKLSTEELINQRIDKFSNMGEVVE